MDYPITVENLKLPDDIGRWDRVRDFMLLRKRVFVDQLKWPLVVYRELEFEQYDHMAGAAYIIARRGDRVVGGVRLLPTDCVSPVSFGGRSYTYMIKDAFDGLLPGMPKGICFESPPTDPTIWEMTRLASEASPDVNEVVLRATQRYLSTQGARECLCLASPVVMRLAKRMGFAPKAIGKIVKNESGRFLAFSCPVDSGSDGAGL